MLTGRRLLITGVITNRSIAYATAARAQELGAEIVLTSFGRARRMTERAAKRLPRQPIDVLELDINNPDDLAAVADDLRQRWGALDGALHAIAHAPGDAFGGNFLATPAESAETAFRTSAYSLKALAATLRPLLAEAGGGSIVGLDFDATVAWPAYDWMGVAKAALEATSRYLARDLGEQNIRCNLVSAGPIRTPAAGGIPGFDDLAGLWEQRSPLRWNPDDAGPVADAVCFLLSDLARGISGEIVHVDGGFHSQAA